MTVRATFQVVLDVAVEIDASFRARVSDPATLARLAEAKIDDEHAAHMRVVYKDATRSRIAEGLVRVCSGTDTFRYQRLVKTTKLHFILETMEGKHATKFRRKNGRQLGSTAWSICAIVPEDLTQLETNTRKKK